MIIYQNNNIAVFQSAIFQLNSTVVATDDFVLIVDPGYLPQEVERIQEYVKEIRGNRPIYLFFTHSDYDHIVGYRAFPEAITIASEQFVNSHEREKQVEDAVYYDHELYLVRPYPIEYPEIHIVIKENGERIQIGQTWITFYHAFGHNHDGLIAVLENEHIAIIGDYLSDIEFPFVYYSFAEYHKTLSTLESIIKHKEDLILITSHGTVTDEKQEMANRLRDSYEYLELVNQSHTNEDFNKFLTAKGYQFTSTFVRRHEDNKKVLSNSMFI